MISDIPGLWIGQASDAEALTGCTVVLTPDGAVGGVDVRGSAPGTRETDLLDPINLVDRVHAVLLAGGSAFGLDAATGVMRWLEERGHGVETGVARVPIVPAAVLFDLSLGRADRRPDAAMGYAACEDAMAADSPRTARVVAEGNVGAGAGASAGKLLGPAMATKTGFGTACLTGPGGLLVGAVVAVNAFGDVRDPSTGAILAGTRNPAGGFLDTAAVLTGQPPGIAGQPQGIAGQPPGFSSGAGGSAGQSAGQNTTIGVVVTNASLSKAGARKVAQMAHDGLALTISPVHTVYDGDTLFALSCGPDESKVQADLSVVGTLAARAVAGAVIRAALSAVAAGGLPAGVDLAAGPR
jgi:L-aminopeptidase/D-esterase-like protein